MNEYSPHHYFSAIELAKLGGTIVVAAREKARGENAVTQITQKSGNNQVKFLQLDLADFSSIREFVQLFNKTYDRLDMLINNAGVMMCPHSKTKDGLEMQIGVNHFGHFLLTNLLLDQLVKSKGRIINVSSAAHRAFGGWYFGQPNCNLSHFFVAQTHGINFEDINSEKSYSPYFAYGQSKLANVLFTYELQERYGKDVTCAVLHPGVVRTEVRWQESLRVFIVFFFPNCSPILQLSRHFTLGNWFFWPFSYLLAKTPLQGAQTTLHCALAPKLDNYVIYGDCKATKSSDISYQVEQRKKLWELSEKVTGLKQ